MGQAGGGPSLPVRAPGVPAPGPTGGGSWLRLSQKPTLASRILFPKTWTASPRAPAGQHEPCGGLPGRLGAEVPPLWGSTQLAVRWVGRTVLGGGGGESGVGCLALFTARPCLSGWARLCPLASEHLSPPGRWSSRDPHRCRAGRWGGTARSPGLERGSGGAPHRQIPPGAQRERVSPPAPTSGG